MDSEVHDRARLTTDPPFADRPRRRTVALAPHADPSTEHAMSGYMAGAVRDSQAGRGRDVNYQVERGDTLSALAKRYGTTVYAIMDANRGKIEDRNLIRTGDTIRIPEAARRAKEQAATVQADAPKPVRAPREDAMTGAAVLNEPVTAAPAVAAPIEHATEQVLYQHVLPVTQVTAPAQAVEAPVANEDPFEQRVVDLVNQLRAGYGLSPLGFDARLDVGAERHTAHMAIVGRMAHDGIGDGTPQERMLAAGWNGAWGENAAVGQTTPEQVVAEWMASPGHRANILNPNFALLAVGYGTSPDGRPYWTQSFGAV